MKKTLAKLKNSEHVTVVAFGDSNTEITFHTAGRMNWVGLLDEAIFETYGNGVCTIVNSGKCGSSCQEGLERLDRDVIRYDPDLVILAFGMNDATFGMEYLPKFKSEVEEIVNIICRECGSEILVRTPNPVVTVNGLPLPEGAVSPGKAWQEPEHFLEEYSQALVETAENLKCPVVDHYSLWKDKQFHAEHPVADPNCLWPRMSDPIHPGFLGHLMFFRELAELFDVPKYFPWEEVGQ